MTLVLAAGCDSGQSEPDTGTVTGTAYSVNTMSPVPGVTVSIGDAISTTGQTGTFTLEHVPVGPRVLQGSAPGFQPFSKNIEVATGTTTVQDLSLSPLSGPTGMVQGTVVEWGTTTPLADALIAIGPVSAQSDAGGAYTLEGVASGTRTISASLAGYLPHSAFLTIETGAVTQHDVVLEPVPVPVPPRILSGVVRLAGETLPLVGVDLTIAGRRAQSGSAGEYSMEDVPLGSHILTATYSGFVTYSDTVSVSGLSTVRDLFLEPEPGVAANSISMIFVRIAAGSFTMGTDAGPSEAGPPHPVTLTRDFWLGKYEVTQGEYFAVTGQRPSLHTGSDRLPVEGVSWYNAAAFANAISVREGLAPCYDESGDVVAGVIYDCEGYRLPTEAEWEYAARAGTTTHYSFGSDYPDRLGDYAWYHDNSALRPHEVGTKLPNPWGLHDMHGNVLEWTQDWWSAYGSSAPVTDPTGGRAVGWKVVRSGDFDGYTGMLWSTYRYYGSPYGWRSIRLARTAR